MKIYQGITALCFIGFASIGHAACTATTKDAIATKIADGHSWTKHSSEYVAGTVIASLKMPLTPKVTTSTEFKSHILSAMSSTTTKKVVLIKLTGGYLPQAHS